MAENSLTSINYEVLRRSWEDFIMMTYASDPAKADGIISAVDWDLWVMTPGLPAKQPALDFSNPDADVAIKLANDYIANAGEKSPANYLDYKKWYAN